MKIEQTSGEFTVLDLGWYTGVVVDVEGAEGKYGPQVKIVLAVPYDGEDGYEEISLWAWTSQKFSSQSNLYKYTREILGRDIGEDEPFDSNNIVGKAVDVKVDTYFTEDGVEKNKVLGMRRTTKAVTLREERAPAGANEEEDIPF